MTQFELISHYCSIPTVYLCLLLLPSHTHQLVKNLQIFHIAPTFKATLDCNAITTFSTGKPE